MKITGPTAFLGAVSGFSCVAIGAFGAHMIKDPGARVLIQTGEQWQIMHTMASFAALSFRNWGARAARFAPFFFLVGIVFFSGSLYAMALGAPRALGMVTPVGGVFFLIGWAIMAWAGWPMLAAARNADTETTS
jgi:uncharacterized membrane protein YgdD (TMEM256/DUF423 family)